MEEAFSIGARDSNVTSATGSDMLGLVKLAILNHITLQRLSNQGGLQSRSDTLVRPTSDSGVACRKETNDDND